MKPARKRLTFALVLMFSLACATGAALSQGRTHKVVAAPGQLDEKSAGIRLIQDYGSYRLYAVADEALSALPQAARESMQLADNMNVIQLDAYPLDTRERVVHIPQNLASTESATGKALYLVQFVGPIKEAWLEEIRRIGVRPVNYIESNAYLVWADPGARAALDRLVAKGDFVQYSGPYHTYYKLGPTLREPLSTASGPDRLVPVTVQILDHEGKQRTRQQIESASASLDSEWQTVLSYEDVAVTLPLSRIAEIAALPDVTWIGERLPITMNDEVQDQIVAAHFDGSQSGPSGPGYKAFLDAKGFSADPNAYPIVAVTDDGVGTGAVANGAGDPTFTALADGTTSRIMSIVNCTTSPTGGGIGGHGHINTSIVGGYDVRAGDPFRDPDGFQRGAGVSPYGRMAMTKIFTDGGAFSIGGCGGTNAGVIAANYNAGGRISSNSWGCAGCAGTYDASSQAYDAGTRDALPGTAGNQELLFVFAAGNSGPGGATVGTPGNGKNMITAAASENHRSQWTDGCAVGPTGADNAMDIIDFSSRGPSPGGRKKPELTAPGTHIQGTASTNPGYTGASVCDQYQPTGQTTFAASSGTSHSTPALAGVASLYYRWLQDHHLNAVPSPALTKAYMMTHTTYLTGAGANDTLPSNSQGYGMPSLEMAFDDTPRYLLDQSVVLNNSGETWTFNGSVADPSRPVRIVMAYTDAAGAVGTSPQVNNLNLTATINGTTTYLGNVFSGRFSTTGGAADNADNYEAVFLPSGTSGALTVTVTGFNIAGDGVPNQGDATDQDFAFVCYNCSQCGNVAMNKQVYNCSDSIAITVADPDILGAGTQNVTLRSTTESAPETITLIESPANSGIFIGSFQTSTDPAVNGDGKISVSNGDTITVRYVDSSHCGDPNVIVESTAAVDCASPVITNVQSSNVTGNSAKITWDTNEPADSSVTYDTTTPPAAGSSGSPALLVSHSITLTGLSPCTPYYYYVGSTDNAGNSTSNTNGGTYYAFTTGVNVQPTYTSTDVPKTILDNQTVNSVINVLDNKTVLDVDVKIGNITHTYTGDLLISLVTPTNVVINLSNRRGAGGDNFINTVFDDEATTPIASGAAPFTGSFKPDQPLTAADGITAAGTWTLRVADQANIDTGTLNAWSLTLTYPTQACGASLQYASSTKNDACNGSGSGGGNAVVEPGEDVTLPVTARNNGTSGTTGISATLTTSTPGVTVTDGSATYPDIPSDGTASSNPNHYKFHVDSSVPCGTNIAFSIHFTSNEGNYNDFFSIPVGAPGTDILTTYTSTDVPKHISDNTVSTSDNIVTDTANVLDVDVKIGNITHTYDGDLAITLIGPTGTRNLLSNRRGAGGDNFVNTVFSDEATTPIASGAAPFTGSFKPDALLSLQDNVPANGTWKLEVSDLANIDTGDLTAWSLTIATPGSPICNVCTSALAGETPNLRWTSGGGLLEAGKDQLEWDPCPNATSYTLYRGVAAGLPSLLNASDDSCTRLTTSNLDSGHVLTEDPAPDAIYWYLVTGSNGSGEGTAGFATAGERQINSTGACPP